MEPLVWYLKSVSVQLHLNLVLSSANRCTVLVKRWHKEGFYWCWCESCDSYKTTTNQPKELVTAVVVLLLGTMKDLEWLREERRVLMLQNTSEGHVRALKLLITVATEKEESWSCDLLVYEMDIFRILHKNSSKGIWQALSMILSCS